jgi:hypothetical protein
LVLLIARICKQAGPAVIFRYYPAVLSAQTGLPAKDIQMALGELQEARWIEYDSSVLWVRNGLRYDPYLNLRNEKQRRGVERAVAELPRSQVVLNFCDYYKITKPFDRVSDSGVTEYRVPSTEVTRVPSTEKAATAPSALVGQEPAGFAEFWAAYPNHENKKQAQAEWRRLRPSGELQARILSAVAAHKQGRKWQEGYILAPHRWLHDEHWDDEVQAAPQRIMNPNNAAAGQRFLERHKGDHES